MDLSRLRLIATWLMLAGAALGLGMSGPALAQTQLTPRDRVIAALENQGYQVTRVRTTWLGRVQIRARSGDLRREVVLNPNTGEVLRDYVETVGRNAGDDRGGRTGRDDHSGNSGSGSRDDDDDGDDSGYSDDDDDDDDRSGSSDDDDDDSSDDDSGSDGEDD